MTETPVSRLILNLGIPTIISMLITSIYNMADTYFVGTLGESAQAATGILFTVQAIMQGLAFMLGHGAGTYVSRALADKNTDEATMYVSTSFFTGIGLGLIISVSGLSFLKPLVHFLGSTDTIAPYAMDYGFWVFLAAPMIICSLILNNCLRYEGKAFYAMFGLTAGGLLNILGDYILVMKLGMGVYGAGLATAASQLVSFTILLIMYLKMAQSTIRFRAVSRKFKTYLSICRVGLPSLIRQGLTSVTMGLLNNMTKPFGDAAIAAMSVVNRNSNFLICDDTHYIFSGMCNIIMYLRLQGKEWFAMFTGSPRFKCQLQSILFVESCRKQFLPYHVLHIFVFVLLWNFCKINNRLHTPASFKNRDGSRFFSYCCLT